LLHCVLLFACADKPPAPIEDRSRPGAPRLDQRYVVLPGDTLYSIAFRYGLEFRRLAAANGIAPPYTIFPGQKLQLAEADPPRSPAGGAAIPARPAPVVKASGTASVKPSVPSSSRTASAPRSTSKTTSPPPVQASTPPSGSSAAPPAVAANIEVSTWRWPVSGSVSRRFETNLHKGIDISGSRGDPVLATAGGTVVYAGSGIAGYGLMLIVRHNEEYLSAYGHNDKLLVDEGMVVRAGQRIAERGSSGTDSVKLHFEIRRRGRPVDPLGLLPRR
jgi:lipoprotein NlpD